MAMISYGQGPNTHILLLLRLAGPGAKTMSPNQQTVWRQAALPPSMGTVAAMNES